MFYTCSISRLPQFRKIVQIRNVLDHNIWTMVARAGSKIRTNSSGPVFSVRSVVGINWPEWSLVRSMIWILSNKIQTTDRTKNVRTNKSGPDYFWPIVQPTDPFLASPDRRSVRLRRSNHQNLSNHESAGSNHLRIIQENPNHAIMDFFES